MKLSASLRDWNIGGTAEIRPIWVLGPYGTFLFLAAFRNLESERKSTNVLQS